MLWHAQKKKKNHDSLPSPRCFPEHLFLLIPCVCRVYFYILSMKHLQCQMVGGRSSGGEVAVERWSVVIAMDPFLYESRHSPPGGKGSLQEGVNGFSFPSCGSPGWAECKLHPAQPLHRQEQGRLRLASAIPSPDPARYSHSHWLQGGTPEGEWSAHECWCYLSVSLMTYIFTKEYSFVVILCQNVAQKKKKQATT